MSGVAETGRCGQEAGARTEERQAAESLAALPGADQSAGRAGAVSAGLFGAAPGAGPHQELLPEVSAASLEITDEMVAPTGVTPGTAEVPQGQGRDDPDASGRAAQEGRAAAGAPAASADVEFRPGAGGQARAVAPSVPCSRMAVQLGRGAATTGEPPCVSMRTGGKTDYRGSFSFCSVDFFDLSC